MENKISTKKLIMLLVITTMIVLVFSLSRYKSTVATQDTTKVAVMANDVTFSIADTVSGYPGYTEMIYPIEITNEVDGQVCEVAQNFTLKLKGLEEANIPLQIGLYSDNSCKNKMTADENGVYKSDDFKFQAGVKATKTFYLKLSWPVDKNSEYYSLEIDYLRIDVELTQID